MKTLKPHLPFFQSLSARKKDRLLGKEYIAKYPDLLYDFLDFALIEKQERIHVIVIWSIELHLVEHPQELTLYLDRYLDKLPLIKDESMRRGLSKILFYYAKKLKKQLTETQKEKIISQSFDWLIEPAQVATVSFALKLLQLFVNEASWIKEELQAIVIQQLPNASPGYRAAARDILK